jgi:hypothetical protein
MKLKAGLTAHCDNPNKARNVVKITHVEITHAVGWGDAHDPGAVTVRLCSGGETGPLRASRLRIEAADALALGRQLIASAIRAVPRLGDGSERKRGGREDDGA